MMFQNNCVFCKIIAREIPASIIEENDTTMVIKDIAPKAPIHYLILPKKHVESVRELGAEDASLASDLFAMAAHISSKLSGSQSFRLISNNGKDAGQSVFHMHLHFLSGKQMLDF